MKGNTALIFGYNEYTHEIEKNIKTHYDEVHLFKLAQESENSFDLSDNWDKLSQKVEIEFCTAFCILEDMAENIFLTISLRDSFPVLPIIALSQDEESQDKLLLAGATSILSTIQTTANVIIDMLERPIVTQVLEDILHEKDSLKVSEIIVRNDSAFEGKYPTDIEWSRDHGVIIISLIHTDNTRDFIYTSNLEHYSVKCGDIFVVMGYDKDIKEFEKLIGISDEN